MGGGDKISLATLEIRNILKQLGEIRAITLGDVQKSVGTIGKYRAIPALTTQSATCADLTGAGGGLKAQFELRAGEIAVSKKTYRSKIIAV